MLSHKSSDAVCIGGPRTSSEWFRVCVTAKSLRIVGYKKNIFHSLIFFFFFLLIAGCDIHVWRPWLHQQVQNSPGLSGKVGPFLFLLLALPSPRILTLLKAVVAIEGLSFYFCRHILFLVYQECHLLSNFGNYLYKLLFEYSIWCRNSCMNSQKTLRKNLLCILLFLLIKNRRPFCLLLTKFPFLNCSCS